MFRINYGKNEIDPKLMLGIVQKRVPDHDLKKEVLLEEKFMDYFENSEPESQQRSNQSLTSFQVEKVSIDEHNRSAQSRKYEDEKKDDS